MTIAQASSAQREPSMGEILASIRRIIEDSDTTRKPQSELDAMPAAANEAGSPARADVDSFRAELGAAAGVGGEKRPAFTTVAGEPATPSARTVEPHRTSEQAPKTFRLADVQAQMAREAAEQPKAPESKRPAPPADIPRDAIEPAAELLRPADVTPAPPPRPVKAEPVPTFAGVDARPGPMEIEEPIQQRSPAPAVREQRETVPPAAPPAASRSSPRLGADPSASLEAVAKPIISQAAGRQVAAAFGQLSEAFALRANKTFDEMAERMLRPMLQEWLDNNLPVLVERLVREEIERVARGV